MYAYQHNCCLATIKGQIYKLVLGVELCCLRVKDQCNSGTDLVPEYLLKSPVIRKAG